MITDAAKRGFGVLAKLVRGKLRAALAKRCPDLILSDAAWRTPWVVHCTAWGTGERCVLDYLARYVFRVAKGLSGNKRFARLV